MPLFDGYVAVDWSAAEEPVYETNSIWVATIIGDAGLQIVNLPTRHRAMRCIEELLDAATEEGHRLLCGFDFPFGYPAGTARALTGIASWEPVWELIASKIEDGHDNHNNRFTVAAALNARFRGEGPFWGRPANTNIPGLSSKKPPRGKWGRTLPPNRRRAEQDFPKAQEVWKLFYPGNAGSQALLGIARLNPLRDRGDVQVWPFQTLGEGRYHVLAEIYPSLIEPAPEEEFRDAGQVRAVATRLRDLDAAGTLAVRLRAPEDKKDITEDERHAVLNEEALFLDITQID